MLNIIEQYNDHDGMHQVTVEASESGVLFEHYLQLNGEERFIDSEFFSWGEVKSAMLGKRGASKI